MSASTETPQSQLIQELVQYGDFLQLSRNQPTYFDIPLTFTLTNGTQVDIAAPGIISFTPLGFGDKDIVLSSGIHGNETAPIEMCEHYVRDIFRGELIVAHRLLFLFGNLPAMNKGSRFIEENLNRLFSGAHSQDVPEHAVNSERLRAKELEQAVADFYTCLPSQPSRQRLHYDLHTAIKPSKNDKFAVYPFRHGRPWNKQQLQFLLACGINTILLSGSATTTFSYYSSNQFSAEDFTVELGKVMPFGQNDMRQFAAADTMLRRLLSGQDLQLKPYEAGDFLIYQVNQVINKLADNFKLAFGDDEPNFSTFKQGDLLATEGDREYRCQQDGEAIVFPNANVALGQRAILTVIPTTI